MRRFAIGSVLVVGLIAGGSSAAFAGETTGKGTPVPRHGTPHSVCSFSGQDQPDSVEYAQDPEHFFPDDNPQGVQNYGHIVNSGGKAFAPSPGEACRGNAEE